MPMVRLVVNQVQAVTVTMSNVTARRANVNLDSLKATPVVLDNTLNAENVSDKSLLKLVSEDI